MFRRQRRSAPCVAGEAAIRAARSGTLTRGVSDRRSACCAGQREHGVWNLACYDKADDTGGFLWSAADEPGRNLGREEIVRANREKMQRPHHDGDWEEWGGGGGWNYQYQLGIKISVMTEIIDSLKDQPF